MNAVATGDQWDLCKQLTCVISGIGVTERIAALVAR